MSSFEAVSHFCSIKCHVSGGNHPWCTRRTPCRLLVRIKGTCSNLIKAQLKQDAPFMFAKNCETEFCCTWYVQKALHSAVNCISRRDFKTLCCSNPVKCFVDVAGCERIGGFLARTWSSCRWMHDSQIQSVFVQRDIDLWKPVASYDSVLVFWWCVWCCFVSFRLVVDSTRLQESFFSNRLKLIVFSYCIILCTDPGDLCFLMSFVVLVPVRLDQQDSWTLDGCLLSFIEAVACRQRCWILVLEASTQHLWGCSPMWMQPGFKFAQLNTELVDELLKNKCTFHQFRIQGEVSVRSICDHWKRIKILSWSLAVWGVFNQRWAREQASICKYTKICAYLRFQCQCSC